MTPRAKAVALLSLSVAYNVVNAQSRASRMPEPIYKQKCIGEFTPERKAEYLKAVGDKRIHPLKTAPWEHTQHQFGFLPFSAGNTNARPIQSAHLISPDATLTRIDIRLDRLRIFEYPGSGKHFVMFTFAADNAVTGGQGSQEAITFSQT